MPPSLLIHVQSFGTNEASHRSLGAISWARKKKTNGALAHLQANLHSRNVML